MAVEIGEIQRSLAFFAEHEASGESPLYAHLAARAAGDEQVAGLLCAAGEQQLAKPTLLLAAAHRLVIAEPVSELADFYPSVGGTSGVDSRVWPVFRSFVLQRAERMRALIGARSTQTNEVRRATALFPALCAVTREAGGPIGLLEVGCSAGLLLGMPHYGYRYTTADGEVINSGAAKSPLVLTAELALPEGARPPKLSRKLPVAAVVGLDRAPVDLAEEEAEAWLEACIWADQPDRLRRLNSATALQRRTPPVLIRGDAVDDLPAAAARIPAELPLVVLTSHVLPYLRPDRRDAFRAALAALAARRPLWWLSQESYAVGLAAVLPGRDELEFSAADPCTTVGVVRWQRGQPQVRVLAQSAPHGERLNWLE
ncbi:MAG: DUF2332 domain-containing protein [Sciscionella sp.]